MPELPELQALCEGLHAVVVGRAVVATKAFVPGTVQGDALTLEALHGRVVASVRRRGKLILLEFSGGVGVVIHLMQAGRCGLAAPTVARAARTTCVEIVFDDGTALRVRELSRTHRAWLRVVEGSLERDRSVASLGPEATDLDACGWRTALTDPPGILHTAMRQGRRVAGVGRCYCSEIMWVARLAPLARTQGLAPDAWDRLEAAARKVLVDAIERARASITTDLPNRQERLTLVHGHFGDPCVRCGTTLARIGFRDYELVYCPTCQTNGRVYADRRMSRFLGHSRG